MRAADFESGCLDVARHWGQRMPMMAIEELGELTQAICKMERVGTKPYGQTYPDLSSDLVDEIGDVLISLEALKQYYRIPQARIDARIESKLSISYPVETSSRHVTVTKPLRDIYR